MILRRFERHNLMDQKAVGKATKCKAIVLKVGFILCNIEITKQDSFLRIASVFVTRQIASNHILGPEFLDMKAFKND